jgi:predicted transcriptional regulator
VPTRSPSLLERIHHAVRPHAGHAPAAAPAATATPAPAAKKSKADDKVAPSPYTSRQAQ